MLNNSADRGQERPFLDFTTPRTPVDTSVTELVRVEVSKFGAAPPTKEFLLNNFKEFTDLELRSVWIEGIKKSWDLVDQVSQYKTKAGAFTIYSRCFLSSYCRPFTLGFSRFVYRLSQPVSLAALIDNPFFYFKREFAADTVIYNCKVLDLTLIPQAIKGSEVTVYVKYTHGEVAKCQIDSWMSLYGTIIEESKYLISLSLNNSLTKLVMSVSFAVSAATGVKTDNYSVRLRLTFQIPEFLPIFGKKARVYYHGMPLFCGGCHSVGHLKVDCRQDHTDWYFFAAISYFLNWCWWNLFNSRWGFIERLKSVGVPLELFGTWVNCNSSVNSSHRSAIAKLPQPNLSTPQHFEGLEGITKEALAKALAKIITPQGCSSTPKKTKRKRDSSSEGEDPQPSTSKGRGKGGRPRGKNQYKSNK